MVYRYGVLRFSNHPKSTTMALSSVGQSKSGIQLLMVLGVVLMVTATAPDLGVKMLILAIGMWFIYNLFNLGRQL